MRNWGALIALMGVLLIYGARKPAVRPVALSVAGASKAIFIVLVLASGFLQTSIAGPPQARWPRRPSSA